MYFGVDQVRILLSLVKCCLNPTEEGNDVIKQQLSTCTFICLSWIERVKLNSIQNHHKYMVRKVFLVFRQFVSRPLRCKPLLWNSLVILTAHFFKTSSGLSTFVSPHFLGEKLVPTIDLTWIDMWMLRYWWQWPDAGTQCKIMRMIIMIIMTTPTRYSVYGDWECKRHRVFLPFGQQKEPYDKVVTIVLMVTMMIMMVNRRSHMIMTTTEGAMW